MGVSWPSLVDHVASLRGRFDRGDRFIYVQNPKAMSGTIDVLLGVRAVHPKMNSALYRGDVRRRFRPGEYAEAVLRYKALTRERVFIFTFVRNPWDRLVSAFAYLGGRRVHGFRIPRVARPAEFRTFVKDVLAARGPDVLADMRPQAPSFALDGVVFADYVGRYESFDRQWGDVAARIGLAQPDGLPHARKSRHGDYREYYDDESVAVVSRVYAIDIKMTGYTFE